MPIPFLATPTETAALLAATRDQTAYLLPPETLAKALILHRTFTLIHFLRVAWTLLQLLLVLELGLAHRMAAFARAFANRWAQGFLLTLQLLLLHTLLDLPLDLYAHRTLLRFHLSIQPWPNWAADFGKQFLVTYVLAAMGVMLFFGILRRFPDRWWLTFAVAASACILAGTFLAPYVYDPLFNTFTPLESADPALVAQLERIIQNAGTSVPPGRIFLMRASAKTTTVNAYVTGFGRSKRVVVWDTSLTPANRPDILPIFAHELGHYVLRHVAIGLTLTMLSLFAEFWLGARTVRWLLTRFGPRWHIPHQTDWAALVVFLLVLAAFDTLAEPLANLVSRQLEHNADVFGQEALHTILPDPAATTALSFQHLGEQSLDLPNPNPLLVFWTYSHPSISERTAFARIYNPWLPGTAPKYFPR